MFRHAMCALFAVAIFRGGGSARTTVERLILRQ